MASQTQIVHFLRLMRPAANAAGLAVLTGGSTPAEQMAVATFDDTTDEWLEWLCRLDNKYGGDGLRFEWAWSAASAPGALAEAGDTGNQLSSWSLSGLSDANSLGGRLYWTLGVEGGLSVVRMYADALGLDLVAAGSVDNATGGTITLAAQNESGLTGSVDVLAYATEDTGPNTLDATRVLWQVGIRRLDADAEDLDDAHTYTLRDAPSMAPSAVGKIRVAVATIADGEDCDYLVAGEYFLLRVKRETTDAGNNLTGDARLWLDTIMGFEAE